MELHIQHGGRWQEPHKEAGPRARETRALQRPGSLRQGTSSLYAQGLRGHDFENYKWHCKTNRRLCIVLTSCLQSVQATIVADQWRRHTQYRFTCCKPTNPARHHKHTDGPFTTTNTGCSFRRTDKVDKALGRATAHLPNSGCVLGHVHTKRVSAVQQLLQTVHMSLSLRNTIHQGP